MLMWEVDLDDLHTHMREYDVCQAAHQSQARKASQAFWLPGTAPFGQGAVSPQVIDI
jgi:dihydroorotase